MGNHNERVDKVLEILTGNINEDTEDIKNRATMRAIMTALLGREPEENQDVTEGGTTLRDFGFDTTELRTNVTDINSWWESQYYHPYVTSKIKKPIVKVWRKIMAPVLRPLFDLQSSYNSAATRSINELSKYVDITNGFMQYQNEVNRALLNENRELKNRLAEKSARTDNEIADIGAQLKKNREIRNELAEKSAKAEADINAKLADLDGRVTVLEPDEDLLDYKAFEDEFRGEEGAVRHNLLWYLPYFEGKEVIYDIGCGRGEFLELLAGAGLKPVGIDNYTPFIDECRNKGLNVVEADGVKFIADCEENSTDGIMLSQVAEHLPKNGLISIINNSYKTLKPGGCLVMETPNPLCLSIYRNAFYTDPTHTRPVHPKYLEFLFKRAGFKEVQIIYTESSRIAYRLPLLEAPSPNLAQFNDGINVLSDMLFGSQDYTVIGIK